MSEHHVWDYVYFLCYLKSKGDAEKTGVENYVAEAVKQQDFSWVPHQNAVIFHRLNQSRLLGQQGVRCFPPPAPVTSEF
jgi:hypothetical protein